MAMQQQIINQLVPGLNEAADKQNYLKSIANEFPFYAAAQLAYVKELSPNDLLIKEVKQRAAIVWHPLMLEQFLLDNSTLLNNYGTQITPIITEEAEQKDNKILAAEMQEEEPEIAEESPTTAQELSGSVMDIAATLESQDSANPENGTSLWDERENLETALAEEMIEANEVEQSEPNTQQDKLEEKQVVKEIFTTQKVDEIMTTHKSLADIVKEEAENTLPAFAKFNTEATAIKNNLESSIPPSDAQEPLLFEPLHTSDYFASQGIKLSEEQIPADKLGKQLKSFTEWLQTMKSVHPINIDLKTNVNQEVNNLAEKSNEEKDVITESMAIAYLAQGKPQKAADVYEKLKLIYPHKSAYFAAELMKLQ